MNRVSNTTGVGFALALLGLLALGGCGGPQAEGAFSYRFADNLEEPTSAVVAELPPPADPSTEAAPGGRPIAVLSTHGDADGRQVAAYDMMTGEALWTSDQDALARPEVHGDVVILSARHHEDPEHVVALDLETGRELWRESSEHMAFVGADREGDTLVYVISVGAAGGALRQSRVAGVNARSGSTVWEHELDGVLGEPAVSGNVVFVPWERQNIAILDLGTGIERARLRSTDDVISWVKTSPAGVFYGNRAYYRLTSQSYHGTKDASTYRATPLAAAPREPMVHYDGFLPKPGTRSARGRIRIYFEPAPSSNEGEIPIVGDTYYYVYYRYVFAFDGAENLRWVRILDQSVANAQVGPRGLLTAGEQGALNLLATETGNDLWTGDLEAEIASISLSAPGFDAGGAGSPGEARDLRASLNEVALDPDNRLVPARAFAIDLLAKIEDAEVTRDLLDLYAQRSTPAALREAIGTSLRQRTTGAEFLTAALDQRYDYLNDTRSPPLGLIVPSLLEIGESAAVPGLIQQMMDHETPLEVLPLVVRGVVELGDEAAVPPLREFLRLYRADSTFQENPEALTIAAEGLFRLGGPEGRQVLQDLIADSRTTETLGTSMRELFEAEQRQAEAQAAAEATAAASAAAVAAREELAARPNRLSQEAINGAFNEHSDGLRECIMAEMGRNPRLAQVRLVFIMEAEGTARDFTFAPNTPEFVACLQPKVEAVEFPKFRQRRQRGSFTISIRGAESEPRQDVPEDDSDQPWYVRHRARNAVAATGTVSGPPWWIRRPADQPQMPTPQPEPQPEPEPGQQQPEPQPEPGQQQPEPQPEPEPGQQQPEPEPEPEPQPEPEPEENPWWLPAQ